MEEPLSTVTPFPGTAPGQHQPPKLLDRVRIAIRTRHYSLRTEEAYVGWIRRYIFFHNKRHPADMGEPEINSFLSRSASPPPRRTRRSAPFSSFTATSSRNPSRNWKSSSAQNVPTVCPSS
jgi:hypothetical protein